MKHSTGHTWRRRFFHRDPKDSRLGQAVGERSDGGWFYTTITIGYPCPMFWMRRLAYNALDEYLEVR